MPGYSKCKITVLKRTVNQDLFDEYASLDAIDACAVFSDGQEFIAEMPYFVPEGFCQWAWADIRQDIKMIAAGADLPMIKEPGTAIVGCTDWFRPVFFKITRLDE